MLIKQKIGSLKDIEPGVRAIEYVYLQWYETAKKILHKKTNREREVVMKFFREGEHLQQDDVIYADDDLLICIDILPVKAIVLAPASMWEMAYLCYEIGNKHLPLFYEKEQLAMPYEDPVFNMLVAAGYKALIENRKLLNQLRTAVTPHGHTSSTSLFSKILQFTHTADAS
jgi:urease accessory protein